MAKIVNEQLFDANRVLEQNRHFRVTIDAVALDIVISLNLKKSKRFLQSARLFLREDR